MLEYANITPCHFTIISIIRCKCAQYNLKLFSRQLWQDFRFQIFSKSSNIIQEFLNASAAWVFAGLSAFFIFYTNNPLSLWSGGFFVLRRNFFPEIYKVHRPPPNYFFNTSVKGKEDSPWKRTQGTTDEHRQDPIHSRCGSRTTAAATDTSTRWHSTTQWLS